MPARQCTHPTSKSVIYDLLIMYHSRKYPYLSHGRLIQILTGRGYNLKDHLWLEVWIFSEMTQWHMTYVSVMAELNNYFLTLFRVSKNHFIVSLSSTHFISKPCFLVFSYNAPSFYIKTA